MMTAEPPPLDAIDRHILDLLQRDNRISNLQLAERVGLSPPACSRRVARLRRAGVIVGDVSLVDARLTGRPISVVVTVSLEDRGAAHIEAFRRKMEASEAVRQCFIVAGSVDFMVVAALPTVEAYSAFAADAFGGDPSVKSYESWVVLSEIKNETYVPVR